MSPRSQRTARLAGWFLLAPLAALLTLSACGGATTSPESVLSLPTSEQPLATAAVEAPTTAAEASSTTAASQASIPVGPPTTSAGYVQVAAAAAPAPAAPAETPGSVPTAAESAPVVSPVAQETTTTTTVAAETTAPTEPAPAAPAPTAAPTTTSTPAETAPPESSTTAAPAPTSPPTSEPVEPVQIVEFRIASGTGSNPWNSFDNPVRVRVGQVLRIHNDDNRAHSIHAGGSPFKHGQRIDPGGFRDHPILRPHQPVDGSPQVYDHNVGRGAPFWVVAES